MKIKALISFSGLITMGIGEVRDIENKEMVKDLLEAGYVKKVVKADKINSKEAIKNEN